MPRFYSSSAVKLRRDEGEARRRRIAIAGRASPRSVIVPGSGTSPIEVRVASTLPKFPARSKKLKLKLGRKSNCARSGTPAGSASLEYSDVLVDVSASWIAKLLEAVGGGEALAGENGVAVLKDAMYSS